LILKKKMHTSDSIIMSQARLSILLVMLILISVVSCKSEREKEKEIDPIIISNELLELEETYEDLLQPILELKTSDPKIYWFIVSWLGTNYKTPSWKGYQNHDWQKKTKIRGIDCSGFVRVMQDKIFNRKIRGGSQGILNRHCNRKKVDDLELGDLVFFRAPRAKNNKIVHIGVYLLDGYFVHATSTRSAALGLGLNINSLDEKMWKRDLVTGCTIKQKKNSRQ
jgi:hypothetical protein